MTRRFGTPAHPRHLLQDARRRRVAARVARAATILCAVPVVITASGLSVSGVPRAAAAPVAGMAQVVTPFDGSATAGSPLTAGGSATPFSLRLPEGAACAGDSANGGYRVQSYMVPSAVDPASLTFNASGPIPAGVGASLRQPLFETTGTAFVDAQTANASTAGGPGPIVNIPAFDLAVHTPGDIPAGELDVGIACTKGPASATQLDRYWNVHMTITVEPGDEPAGVTWTATEMLPTSSTSSSSSSTSTSSTSSSSTSSSTSSTTSSSSTTTTAPTSTSTTTPSCGTTSTTAPATTTSSTTSSTSSTTTSTSTTSTSTTSSTTSSTSTTSTSTTTPPTPPPPPPPPPPTPSTTTPSTTSSTTAAAVVGQSGSVAVLFDATETCLPPGTTIPSSAAAGGSIDVSSTGWEPASEVAVVLHSDPVDLGELTADDDGLVAGSLPVPASVPAGDHELVLTGTDASGAARTVRAPITIVAADAVATTTVPGPLEGTATLGGSLPRTGSSPLALLAWSVLLLVLGRMAVLLGRPPRLLPPLQ